MGKVYHAVIILLMNVIIITQTVQVRQVTSEEFRSGRQPAAAVQILTG